MALLNYYKVIARTTEAKTKSKIISSSWKCKPSYYQTVGDFHVFDCSPRISPHRIPSIVFSAEIRIFFSQKSSRLPIN